MSDGIDWDNPKTPTPSWETFERLQRADPNLWWRIGCGHHENLYDNAVDEIKRLRGQLVRLNATAFEAALQAGWNDKTIREAELLDPEPLDGDPDPEETD